MTDAENETRNTIVDAVKSQIDRLERALQRGHGETETADRQTLSVDPAVEREIEKLRENIRSVQRAIEDGIEAATCTVDALEATVQGGSRRLRDKTVDERNALLTDQLGRLKGAAEKASRDRQELAQRLAALNVERLVLDDLMKSVENVS